MHQAVVLLLASLAVSHSATLPLSFAFNPFVAVASPANHFVPLQSFAPAFTATQYHAQDEFGQASFGYAHPGQAATNFRDAFGNQVGSYAYINPEGKEIRVSYVADSNGFRVLSNALPEGPAPLNVALPAPVQDTPEVAAAKAAHFAAVAEAKARNAAASSEHSRHRREAQAFDLSALNLAGFQLAVADDSFLPVAHAVPQVAVAQPVPQVFAHSLAPTVHTVDPAVHAVPAVHGFPTFHAVAPTVHTVDPAVHAVPVAHGFPTFHAVAPTVHTVSHDVPVLSHHLPAVQTVHAVAHQVPVFAQPLPAVPVAHEVPVVAPAPVVHAVPVVEKHSYKPYPPAKKTYGAPSYGKAYPEPAPVAVVPAPVVPVPAPAEVLDRVLPVPVAAPAPVFQVPAPVPVVAHALPAPVFAAPAPVVAAVPAAVPAVTVSRFHSQDELGQASFGHSTPDQAHSAFIDADGNQVGSYVYINPEGKEVRVHYTAGVGGFRVLSNALPEAPSALTLGGNAIIQDTAEVQAARQAHFVAFEEARNRIKKPSH